MTGYDCKIGDISIQSVNDVSPFFISSSRSLTSSAAAAGVETMLTYSITTPTFIFDDTNVATEQFIQALNESIATGYFDIMLHSMGSTEWQSVSTDYAIFTTASPSSSPTSSPTSVPTKRDNVAANLLDVPLDAEVAKIKIKYYLGAFVGYFFSIYICLYLYSFLQYGTSTATKFYDTSYQSEAYIRHSAITNEDNKINVPILSELYKKNAQVQNTMKLEVEIKKVQSVARKSASTTADDGTIIESSSVNRNSSQVGVRWSNLFKSDEVNKYSKGYRKYVNQQRTLLGCSPLLYPQGYVMKIPCTSKEIVLPPGRIEDLLLFLCHNHPLFSCFYFMAGSKLGAHGTRILYIGKDVAVFVLYQFSNMLLQYFMIDAVGLGTFINLFIITPSAVSIGLLLKYLYTCPFTETVEFQRKYAKYQYVVLFLGRLAIVPIMLLMCSFLIIACLFSSDRRIVKILVDYFLYVQFYGIMLAIVKAVLMFVDTYYYNISIFGLIDVVCVGQLFKERIIAEQLVLDVDYAYRIDSYLLGFIHVQKILNRDDAIKAKWITEETAQGYGDIEMKPEVIPRRGSTIISMDSIYDSSNFDEKDRGCYTTNYTMNYTVEANPIHLAANSARDIARDDDDEALFLEYQSLQSQHDEAVYDMNDNEAAITFEEWKSRSKQFKQGTRGSFVKAFQVFAEREQLARDNIDQSASVKNTMHLHRSTVKNVLASKSTKMI
jgi:hypothetical protein